MMQTWVVTIILMNGGLTHYRPSRKMTRIFKLSQGQDQFVEKYFHDYVSDTALKKAITKKQPRQSHDSLKILKPWHC